MQYRYLAKESLKKATTLLAGQDADQLPYACLELRKCIETLSYELLTGYLAEASMKVIETWQPDKVMKELVRIDPGAEHNSFLRMRQEGPDGEPAGDWINLGEDRVTLPLQRTAGISARKMSGFQVCRSLSKAAKSWSNCQ